MTPEGRKEIAREVLRGITWHLGDDSVNMEVIATAIKDAEKRGFELAKERMMKIIHFNCPGTRNDSPDFHSAECQAISKLEIEEG